MGRACAICMDQRKSIGFSNALDPLNLDLGLVQKLLQTGTGHLLKVAGGSQAEEVPQGAMKAAWKGVGI